MQDKRKITIEDLEKKHVFNVPEGYFKHLPQQISHKLVTTRKSQPWFILPVFKYGAAIASFCLIILIGYFLTLTPVPNPVQPEIILSQVSGQDIVQYLQQSEVSQFELVERASEANIIIEEKALDEVEVNQEFLLEEIDPELIEELI
jgi:hypothetical protein